VILDRILETKRNEITGKRAERSFTAIRREAEARFEFRSFSDALRAEGVSLIAEIKKASPSAGVLREDFRVTDLAAAYERAGASAISVLTDESYFQGALGHLAKARAAASLPLLRKDFVIDEYQVAEAAAAGADAFLLIAAALSRGQTSDYIAFGKELGLDALVEVHTGAELDDALAAGAEIVGVNNRDLRTFTVDLNLSLALGPAIPAGVIRVSESGIGEAADLERLAGARFDAVLVGTTLVRDPDPEAAARRLLGRETT